VGLLVFKFQEAPREAFLRRHKGKKVVCPACDLDRLLVEREEKVGSCTTSLTAHTSLPSFFSTRTEELSSLSLTREREGGSLVLRQKHKSRVFTRVVGQIGGESPHLLFSNQEVKKKGAKVEA